jgi:hypothetical protein
MLADRGKLQMLVAKGTIRSGNPRKGNAHCLKPLPSTIAETD